MSFFSRVFKSANSNDNHSHQAIHIGEHTVCLNSRGRIPVILQRMKNKHPEVIDLVYMDYEALKLSIHSREIYVYRRSKGKVESFRYDSEQVTGIKSIQIASNGRSLLVTIDPGKSKTASRSFIYEINLNKGRSEIWTAGAGRKRHKPGK